MLVMSLARSGCNQAKIARKLRISLSTLRRWAVAHAELAEALKEGRRVAAAFVEDGLYRRARGFDTEQTEVKQDAAGKRTVRRVKKHVPPDVRAAIFWLTHQCPEKWDKDPHDKAQPPRARVRRASKPDENP
jgi:hypothetical protein